jgi:glycosyltransferase involved in cell wall biosynthesis
LLHELSFLNLPVITDANELDYWIDQSGKENMEYIARYTKHYITASQSVADCLIRRGYATQENAEPNYVIVDIERLSDSSKLKSLHSELSIPENALIIGSCGAEVFRKGKDLFLHVANDILSRDHNREIHFVWIGGLMTEEIQFDWERSPYRSHIHFMDHTPHAGHYFHDFDIFLMLSRDDPFPIVNVEVGIWGVPVICFEDTGGATELIGEEGGISVPYGDLRAYGDTVFELINDEEKRKKMGLFLKEKVMNNYGVDRICNRLINIIERVYSGLSK